MKLFSNFFLITGIVLDSIRSYLHNRSQRVIINDTPSATFPLISGVPQGSVIGPLLFLLYTRPLSKVIDSQRGIHQATYADDIQIYITLKPNGKDKVVRKLSRCFEDIRVWSFNNRLCLNERKSEMIHITSKLRNTDSPPPPLTWLPEMAH